MTTTEWTHRLRPPILYTLAGLAIFLAAFYPVLLYGEGTLVRGWDGSVQSYAWWSKLARSWGQWTPPVWDFESFSGTSFAGEIQTGVFYPGNALLGLLSDGDPSYEIEAYLYLHYVLAFVLMAWFLASQRFPNPESKGSHLRWPAVLFGAFAFAAYLDWTQPHRMVGMVYLPLVLLCVQRGIRAPSGSWLPNPWICAGGISWGLMILAGHIQPYLHTGFAVLLFCLLAVLPRPLSLPKLAGRLAFMTVISALFSSPQWLLGFEHYSRSYRWAPEKTPGLSRVGYEVYGFVDVLEPELIEFLVAGWMPIAVLLSLIVIIRRAEFRPMVLFGAVLLVFSSLASLGDAGYLSRLMWHIPIVNSAREAERYVFLILFALALLLALAVEGLWRRLEHETGSGARWGKPLLVILLVPTVWLHASVFLRIQAEDDPLSPSVMYARGEIVEFLRSEYREKPDFRVFNFKQTMAPNLGNAHQLLTIRGHRATILKPYHDFVAGALDDPYSEKLDLLGVKYLISPQRLEGLPLLIEEGHRFLYQKPNFVPVFHLYLPETGERKPAPVQRVEFGPNRVELTLSESVTGTLVFSQPHFPGWQSEADGETRPVNQVGLFMGVELDGGEKNIRFAYRPGLLWLGLAGVLVAAAACVLSVWIHREFERSS